MSQPFTDEFLNDFIDGQLSGEELLRAEKFLRENASFREQVESYRAMGLQIKSLPRKSLPGDFSQTIVQKLEAESTREIRPPAESLRTHGNSLRRSPLWRITLIAGALAASFMLGVFLLQNQPRVAPELATAPKSTASPSIDSAGSSVGTEEKHETGRAIIELNNGSIEDQKRTITGKAQALPLPSDRSKIDSSHEPDPDGELASGMSANSKDPGRELFRKEARSEVLTSGGEEMKTGIEAAKNNALAPKPTTLESSDIEHWLVEIPDSPADREKIQQALGKYGLTPPEALDKVADTAAGNNLADIFEVSGTIEAMNEIRQQLAQAKTFKSLTPLESKPLIENGQRSADYDAKKVADEAFLPSVTELKASEAIKPKIPNLQMGVGNLQSFGGGGGRGSGNLVAVKFIGRQSVANGLFEFSKSDEKMKPANDVERAGSGGGGGGLARSARDFPRDSSVTEKPLENAAGKLPEKSESLKSRQAPSPGVGGLDGGKPAADEPAAAFNAATNLAEESNNRPAEMRRVRIVIRSQPKPAAVDPSVAPADKK